MELVWTQATGCKPFSIVRKICPYIRIILYGSVTHTYSTTILYSQIRQHKLHLAHLPVLVLTGVFHDPRMSLHPVVGKTGKVTDRKCRLHWSQPSPINLLPASVILHSHSHSPSDDSYFPPFVKSTLHYRIAFLYLPQWWTVAIFERKTREQNYIHKNVGIDDT